MAPRPRRPARVPTLTETVATGRRRESLEAIRDRLAGALAGAEGREVAVLAKELRAVIAEIDRLPGGAEVTRLDKIAAGVSDELAARRTARRADTAGS